MPVKIVAVLTALLLATAASAQPATPNATTPAEVAAQLRFWATDPGQPVYYGEVRNVDARTLRILGHYQCLALAFIKSEAGVIQYAHKMWSKSPDGSCHYEDVTSRKVGNHGACVKDSEAGFGYATGTARMTKANIDVAHSIFRTVDTNTRRVGETAACVPPRGVGAGLRSMVIQGGRLKIMTTRPLDYEVDIQPQDPEHPPTKPVF